MNSIVFFLCVCFFHATQSKQKEHEKERDGGGTENIIAGTHKWKKKTVFFCCCCFRFYPKMRLPPPPHTHTPTAPLYVYKKRKYTCHVSHESSCPQILSISKEPVRATSTTALGMMKLSSGPFGNTKKKRGEREEDMWGGECARVPFAFFSSSSNCKHEGWSVHQFNSLFFFRLFFFLACLLFIYCLHITPIVVERKPKKKKA